VVRKKLEIKWQAARTFDHGCLYEKGLATKMCAAGTAKRPKKKVPVAKEGDLCQSKTFREEKKEDDESQRLGDRRVDASSGRVSLLVFEIYVFRRNSLDVGEWMLIINGESGED
jgi:hypothetical protein